MDDTSEFDILKEPQIIETPDGETFYFVGEVTEEEAKKIEEEEKAKVEVEKEAVSYL